MVRFLFWNLSQRKFPAILREAVELHRIDVLMLAESPWSGGELLTLLNHDAQPHLPAFQLPMSYCRRIQFVSRFSPTFVPAAYESDYVSVRKFLLPARSELLVVGLHLPSKRHARDDSLAMEAARVARKISEIEEEMGHRRTIVVGDFNQNPFESGMVGAYGFHAVRTTEVALRNSRTVLGASYPFFYNPMWRFYAEAKGEPAGTFYYEKSEHVTHFWHLFDQLLIRPSLLPGFDATKVAVLTEVGGNTLVNRKGRPEVSVASDHLPLSFWLEF